jgi:hypothetical protein
VEDSKDKHQSKSDTSTRRDLQKLFPGGLTDDKDKQMIDILEGARADDNIEIIEIVNIKKIE